MPNGAIATGWYTTNIRETPFYAEFHDGRVRMIPQCKVFRKDGSLFNLTLDIPNEKLFWSLVKDLFDSSDKAEEYWKRKSKGDLTDMVNHPSHYAWLKDLCGVEPIDICRQFDFNVGNALKYLMRKGKKDGDMTDKEKRLEDLRKAVFYLNDEIVLLHKIGIIK